MSEFQRFIILLIKSALLNEKEIFEFKTDWLKIIEFSKRQQILPMIYYGILNSSLALPEKDFEILENYTYQIVAIDQNQKHTISLLKKEFIKNNIDYMLLKGSMLKNIYPKSEMRDMSDIDILVREEQYINISPILTSLGYKFKAETSHDYEWKNDLLNIELHKFLIPPQNKDYYKFFETVWNRALKAKDNEYILNDEDQMIYLFLHFTKHFRSAGIGIRHIIDLWIFRSFHKSLNEKTVIEVLKGLGVDEFYRNIMETLETWFDNKKPNEVTSYITNYIFESGSFGKHKNSIVFNEAVSIEASAFNSKIRYIIKTVFPSLAAMKLAYPILKTHPILLPVVWVKRLIMGFVYKRERLNYYVEGIHSLDSYSIQNKKEALKFVGIKIDEG